MHRILIPGALCLALGACATASSQSPAACDGRHRRPANPNGSVLPGAPQAAPAAPGRAAAPATVRPMRRADLTASYAPCGRRA